MENIINTIESKGWEMIVAQFPGPWRTMANTYGLFSRKLPEHMGAKFTDIEEPLRLVLHHAGNGVSLKVTTAAAAAAGLTDISHVALHKWMIKIGPYLADLCGRMAGDSAAFSSDRWAGYEVMTVDASALCCPGAEGTTARVHYVIRLSDLHPVEIQVTDHKGGETYRRFEPLNDQLWIGDRGYANPPGIAFIKESGAEALVRYNFGSLPLYDETGQTIDVRRWLWQLKKTGATAECEAWVHPKDGEPIRGRLCAVRLPPDKAEKARKRIRREYGSAATREMLAAANYVVVFTTIPSSRLNTVQILELYRLRWQVELFIKRDKSIGGLDAVPNYKPETIRSWICAKVLLLLIARKIASEQVSFPPGEACSPMH